MISHNSEFYGDIAPEVWKVPGDGFVYTSGEDYLDKIKQKELVDKKANKNKLNLNNEENEIIDAYGNKIQVQKKFSGIIERSEFKKLQKEFKDLKKRQSKGEDIDEDRIFELEEQVKIAEEYINKEKALKKTSKK